MVRDEPANGLRVADAALPDPQQRPTVPVEEAAQWIGISRSSAYAAVRAGEIPSIRIGHRLLVPTAELRRLLGVD